MKKFISSMLAMCLSLGTMQTLMPIVMASPQTVVIDPTSYIVDGFTWVNPSDTTEVITYEERGVLTDAKGKNYYNPMQKEDGTNRKSAVMRFSYTAKDWYYDDDVLYIENAQPLGYANNFTVDIPFSIPADGWYTPQYLHSVKNHKQLFSHLHMTVTNNSVEDDKGVIVASTLAGGNINNAANKINVMTGAYAQTFKGMATYMKKGNYTLHLKVYDTDMVAGKYSLLLDDILFVPTDPKPIASIGETRIEYEDIDPAHASAKANISDSSYIDVSSYASGGKIITDFYSLQYNSPHTVRMIVDVQATGSYKWTSVMNKGNGTITLTCDGVQFASTGGSGEDVSQGGKFITSTYPMTKYSGTISLDAGEHIIELTVSGHKNPTFFADYFALESGRTSVSGTEATTIEMEDYVSQFTATNSDWGGGTKEVSGASGGKVLGTTWGKVDSGYVVYSIPVSVSEAGYYDTEFVASSIIDNTLYNQSVIYFAIDDDYIGDSNQSTSGASKLERMSAVLNGYFPLYKIKGETVYISEGDHTIKMYVRVAGSGDATTMSSGMVKFGADYLKLTPAKRVNIASDKKTVFELEDYNNRLTNTFDTASGGKLLNHSWHFSMAKNNKLLNMPIKITKKGFYKFESVLSIHSGAVSTLTLKLDNESVLSNTQAGEDVSGIISGTSFPAYKYDNIMFLEEGEYTLSLVATYGQKSNDFYLQKLVADYVSVEMVDPGDTLSQEDNSLVINGSFGDKISGKAYAAFYMQDKLIKLVSKDMNNESYAYFQVPNIKWEDYDRATVYAWGDKVNPLADKKNFSILPKLNGNAFEGDDEVNVVFLGASITEGQGVSDLTQIYGAHTGEWFKETYTDSDTTVNYYIKGHAGSPTDYSLIRLKRDVIDYDPDVVFLQITTNDVGDTTRNIESIVRTLNTLEEPPYIIFLFFPKANFQGISSYGKAVADHYGIPMISMLDMMKKLKDDGVDMTKLFPDGVHPTAEGHALIAEEIIDSLKTNRFFQKSFNSTPKLNEKSGELDIDSMTVFEASDESVVTKSGTWTEGTTTKGKFIETANVGDSITFTANCNVVGYTYYMHKTAGDIEMYVDGKLIKKAPAYASSYNQFAIAKADSIYFDLPDGEHEITLKVVANSNSSNTSTRIGQIFTANWAD